MKIAIILARGGSKFMCAKPLRRFWQNKTDHMHKLQDVPLMGKKLTRDRQVAIKCRVYLSTMLYNT